MINCSEEYAIRVVVNIRLSVSFTRTYRYHDNDSFYCSHFEWLKFDMLMYPDHFRADKIWVIICSFSSFWHHFDLVKQTKFANSGHFLENAREEWCEPWCADISWPPSELIKFWSWSVDFPIFWHHFHLVQFGVWQFSSECMGGIACNLTCWCILTTFSNAYIFGNGLLIFLILAGIWLSETSHICRFRAFSWERIGGIGLTNLVMFEEMEKANFQHTKIIQSPSGGIPDCCVVRLF